MQVGVGLWAESQLSGMGKARSPQEHAGGQADAKVLQVWAAGGLTSRPPDYVYNGPCWQQPAVTSALAALTLLLLPVTRRASTAFGPSTGTVRCLVAHASMLMAWTPCA